MANHKNKQADNKRKVLVAFFVVLFVASISLILELTGKTNFISQKNTPSTDSGTKPTNTVDYGPPTKEEQSAGDQQKEKIVESEKQNSEKNTEAEVIIVDASQYDDQIEVRAYVANVLENGVCTFIFTLNGQTSVARTTNAYPDASTTPCLAISVPRSEFSKNGSWELTVTYDSSSAKGSKVQKVEIK